VHQHGVSRLFSGKLLSLPPGETGVVLTHEADAVQGVGEALDSFDVEELLRALTEEEAVGALEA
jgi:hypothetical protein